MNQVQNFRIFRNFSAHDILEHYIKLEKSDTRNAILHSINNRHTAPAMLRLPTFLPMVLHSWKDLHVKQYSEVLPHNIKLFLRNLWLWEGQVCNLHFERRDFDLNSHISNMNTFTIHQEIVKSFLHEAKYAYLPCTEWITFYNPDEMKIREFSWEY